jgi:uncharacterized protein (TIGR03118 family)
VKGANVFVLLALLGLATQGLAQQTSYQQTNLVANVAGVANHTDAQLSNPWGIAFIPGQTFWVSNNNGGTSTQYDAQGNKMQPTVTIPSAAMNPCSPGCPTGVVANSTLTNFNGALFIFDSEDGILAAWNGTGNATTVVDNSAAGAVYKGLALVSASEGDFLLAANFRSGKIDVFDHNFHSAALAGSFTDPNLPAGMAPHGVHLVNNQVYVVYAMQDSAKHDPVPGAGSGVVDVFDLNGNFVKRFTAGGPLNAPWGLVQASANFGGFSNDILIGNFGDGTIQAYDSAGNAQGMLADSNQQPLANPGLWDLVVGANGTGDPNTLYLTAGGSDQTQGLFASIMPGQAVTKADFSLNLSASSATVSVGQSTSLAVSASGAGGFNSPISLSCSGQPVGVTCGFSPGSITPGSSAASSTLTIAVATTYVPMGYRLLGVMLAGLPGLGLIGFVLDTRHSYARAQGRSRTWVIAGAVLLLGLLLAGVGCGSNSSKSMVPVPQTLTVTGSGGGITHSAVLTLNVQ